ncbi:MAG: sortase [Woeseiaceae bacterium]
MLQFTVRPKLGKFWGIRFVSLRWLTISSVLLIVTGIGLLGYFAAHRVDTTLGHRDGIDSFRAAQAAQPKLADEATASATTAGDVQDIESIPLAGAGAESEAAPDLESLASPDMSLWSEKRIADYRRFAAESANAVPEGILRIPSVELELHVFDNTAEPALTRGAGWIKGTAPLGADGNIGIAAHRDGYFRALKDVSAGDEIEIETLWSTDRYRIVNVTIVDPSDVHVLMLSVLLYWGRSTALHRAGGKIIAA